MHFLQLWSRPVEQLKRLRSLSASIRSYRFEKVLCQSMPTRVTATKSRAAIFGPCGYVCAFPCWGSRLRLTAFLAVIADRNAGSDSQSGFYELEP